MSNYVAHAIDVDATINADGNSAPFVRPRNSRDANVSLLVQIDDAPTGTNPTLNFKLQCSLDGVLWIDAAATGNKNAAGSARVEAKAIEPMWRLARDIGGTGGPAFTGVHTWIVFSDTRSL